MITYNTVIDAINHVCEDQNRDWATDTSSKKVYWDDMSDRHDYFCSKQEVADKLVNNLKNFYLEKFEDIQIKAVHQNGKSFSYSTNSNNRDRDYLDYKVSVYCKRKPTWTRDDAYEFSGKQKDFFKKLKLTLSKAYD
jgi:hypothetical protein